MTLAATSKRLLIDPTALMAAVFVFLVHALFASRYDLFRDELYFIVCGRQPAFGYVDQPPLVPLLAAGLYKLGFGGAWSLRLPGSIASGALVYISMRFVRFLNGDGVSVALAALAVSIAPMLLGLIATLNTTLFDPLAWTAIALLLLRAIRQDDDRALLLAGLVAGLDLQVKYALLFWVAGLTVGLLVTPQRQLLRRRAFWIALGIGALVALPSFIWQALHGFPFLELAAAAQAKNADVQIVPFIVNQILVMNPAFAPLWLAGLVGPFVVARFKDVRFFPIACLVVLVIVRLGHGKDYYLAPCFPVLFIVGAVILSPVLRTTARKVMTGLMTAMAVGISLVAAPIAMPILSPSALVVYMTSLGIAPQQQEKSFQGSVLPQVFADQLGWHDFTRQVVDAWHLIPAAERAATGIKADNYGEAAAIDVYAGPQGLPPALSGHNQYFLWGLRGQHPLNLLVVQDNPDALRPYCDEMRILGKTHSPFALANENRKTIAFCRKVKPSLAKLWPTLKNYN